MTLLMRIQGAPGIFELDPDVWVYLRTYDPYNGFATFTSDPNRAIQYSNLQAVLLAWKSVHQVEPLRPDGRPNRPLTAFTILPTRWEDVPR